MLDSNVDFWRKNSKIWKSQPCKMRRLFLGIFKHSKHGSVDLFMSIFCRRSEELIYGESMALNSVWIAHNHQPLFEQKNHSSFSENVLHEGCFHVASQNKNESPVLLLREEGKTNRENLPWPLRIDSFCYYCSVLGLFRPSTNVLVNTTRPPRRHDGPRNSLLNLFIWLRDINGFRYFFSSVKKA